MRTARGSAPWIALPLVVAALGWIVDARISLVGAVAVLAMVAFFRDPERHAGDGILSPCDGRVLTASADEVAIFLGVTDVHVVRAPYAGRVTRIERFGDGHRSAYRGTAKRNAGVRVTLATAWGELDVRLIAGLVARRALSYHAPGAEVVAGERLGIIRFGSRVEVELPPGSTVEVGPNDRVRAAETTLAEPPQARPRIEEAMA